jgi:hypothetical protein
LKRSTCPTCNVRPARSAAAIIASASATVIAIGFSTSTWQPAASACCAASRCETVGVATETGFALGEQRLGRLEGASAELRDHGGRTLYANGRRPR